jgi:hypothetical protein
MMAGAFYNAPEKTTLLFYGLMDATQQHHISVFLSRVLVEGRGVSGSLAMGLGFLLTFSSSFRKFLAFVGVEVALETLSCPAVLPFLGLIS